MNINPHSFIILTGAGFSHNFGCPLAQEMWAWIFNNKNLQKYPKLKELFQQNFDYESAIASIRNESYSPEEKKAAEDALNTAYDSLDEIVKNYSSQKEKYGIDWEGLKEWLQKFQDEKNAHSTNQRQGFIFTLNQDLFLERHFYFKDLPGSPPAEGCIKILGAPGTLDFFNENYQLSKNPEKDYWNIEPSEDAEETVETIEEQLKSNHRFYYVKLHGSQNWRNLQKENQMVIGADKIKQIEKIPLLKKYHDVFESVLCYENTDRVFRKLLIIGYGFGDPHINNIILRGMDKNLKVYVLSPENPASFKKRLVANCTTKQIWKKLSGYFPFMLKDIFPINKYKSTNPTEEFNLINKHFHSGEPCPEG